MVCMRDLSFGIYSDEIYEYVFHVLVIWGPGIFIDDLL